LTGYSIVRRSFSSGLLRVASEGDPAGKSIFSRVASRGSIGWNRNIRPASRREQFLFILSLICMLQIAWMRPSQSNSIFFWVRDFGDLETPEPGRPALRTASLPSALVLPQSPDTCAELLQTPRVALLFLTTGHLHHEATWKLWFKSAAGVIPLQTMAMSICKAELASQVLLSAARACKRNSTNVIDNQHLFSVYIHAPPAFAGYHDESLWARRVVTHRVATSWGAHTLVEATRHLIWEAFRDPLNTHFVLLSESDIPLYDPLTMWQQLQAETRSRVDTCRHQEMSAWRWDPRMQTGRLKFHHWRKSPQWLALTRSHASLVLSDEEVFRRFERYCWSSWDAANSRWHKDCFSDEHYFATLLSVEGRDKEGVCESRGVSFTEWEENSAHPKAFSVSAIDAELVRKARAAPRSAAGRSTPECGWRAAQAQAQQQFVPMSSALSTGSSMDICARVYGAAPPTFTAVMPDTCFLMGRKFPRESRSRVRDLFLQCGNGINLLRQDVCEAEGGVRCGTLWGRVKGLFSRYPC